MEHQGAFCYKTAMYSLSTLGKRHDGASSSSTRENITCSSSSNVKFRPPAVPLVTHDPYFSIWSFDDRLTDRDTKHWTNRGHNLCGLLRVDGKTFRFMGKSRGYMRACADIQPLEQKSVEVLPTRTIYTFESNEIEFRLTFLSPLLPFDLELVSRPVTYIMWDIRSKDGRKHDVSVYLEASSVIATHDTDQQVTWGRVKVSNFRSVLRVGCQDMKILQRFGDQNNIDWGYLYFAPSKNSTGQEVIAPEYESRNSFYTHGTLPENDDVEMPRKVTDSHPVLALTFTGIQVENEWKSDHALIAYDDLYSLEYFQRKLKPYWKRNGMQINELLEKAENELPFILETCKTFDAELMRDLVEAGGEKYAQLCSLSFRQCLAGHKLVADLDGTLLHMSKENSSNGCIATVDVTYPAAPFFLLFNPELLKAQLTPILDYSMMPRWKFPFAPHDLGTYPQANGQRYGGGETSERNQMPVEECGNMLIMVAALVQATGDADYALKYWSVLEKWAAYLEIHGFDPENQLCTDDFAGHLSRNANLSVKAIVGLGAFGRLCELVENIKRANHYTNLAKKLAAEWALKAWDGEGYVLAFDSKGTWSQKYNLVWDKLLNLKLFNRDIFTFEIEFYKKKSNEFGVPLDSRKSYTKLDWLVWSACLADNQKDFEAIIEPAFEFAHRTAGRVPLADWHDTVSGNPETFKARSVVGGLFIKLLMEKDRIQAATEVVGASSQVVNSPNKLVTA